MNSTSKTPPRKKAAKKKVATRKAKATKKTAKVKVNRKASKPLKAEEPKPKTLVIENKPEFFAKNGYLPVKEFVSPELSNFLYKQLLMKVERNEFITDQQSPDQPAWAGETFLDAILVEHQKKAEELVGYELYPTYTYARMYNPGAILDAHKDRPSCEVSFTCTLGFEGEPQSLFFCEDKKPEEELPAGELTNEEIQRDRMKNTPTKMVLSKPGDAALYKGCELIHWRDEVKNVRNLAQIFLHYVAKNGRNSTHKYDGRPPSFFLRGPLD